MNTVLKVIAALVIAVGAFTFGSGTASKAAPSFHCSTHCYSPDSIGGFDCTTNCD